MCLEMPIFFIMDFGGNPPGKSVVIDISLCDCDCVTSCDVLLSTHTLSSYHPLNVHFQQSAFTQVPHLFH